MNNKLKLSSKQTFKRTKNPKCYAKHRNSRILNVESIKQRLYTIQMYENEREQIKEIIKQNLGDNE